MGAQHSQEQAMHMVRSLNTHPISPYALMQQASQHTPMQQLYQRPEQIVHGPHDPRVGGLAAIREFAMMQERERPHNTQRLLGHHPIGPVKPAGRVLLAPMAAGIIYRHRKHY